MLVVILLLIAGVVGLIQVPAVQTFLVQKVSQNLSETLGTEVSVGAVRIDFPDYAVFEDVLVRDLHQDTMFYIGELRAALRDLDRDKYLIKFRRVELDRAKVYLVQHAGDPDLNFQFIIDQFTPDVPDPTAPVWIAFSDKLILKDSRFVYRIEDDSTENVDGMFNENDIVVQSLNTVIRSFSLAGDSLSFDVRELTAKDHSGLEISAFKSRTRISSTVMAFEDLQLNTPDSEIKDNVIFRYSGYGMLGYFIDSVHIESAMNESRISIKDIARFSEDLLPYASQVLQLTTTFEGRVAGFSALNTDLRFGEKGMFLGDLYISGMPQWDTSYMEMVFDRLVFDGADLQNSFGITGLPDQVLRLGTCDAKGSFKGRVNEFHTAAKILTDAGSLETSFVYNGKVKSNERYSGKLDVTNMDVGRILKDSIYGTTSFTLELKEGQGLNLKNLHASLKGKIHHAVIAGYDYKDILIDGVYDSQNFIGKASIDDQNAQITFDGRVDLHREVPYYNFYLDIAHLDLMALGFDTVPMTIQTAIACEMHGAALNDLDGTMKISNLKINREDREVELLAIELFAGTNDTARYISLYSDVADVQISGKFDFTNLSEVYAVFLNDLFPEYYHDVDPLESPVEIDFRVRVYSSEFLTTLLDSQLIVGPGVFIGTYASARQSLAADAKISIFQYGENRLNRIDLSIRKEPGELLNMSIEVDSVYTGHELITSNVLLNASVQPNKIEFLFNFAEPTDEVALRSFGVAEFAGDTITLRLEESSVYINGRQWDISNGNQVIYTPNLVNIKNLSLLDSGQSLYVSGDIGPSVKDSIVVVLKDFELNNLNPVLAASNLEISGYTNGTVLVMQATGQPVFHGNIRTASMVFNGDTLGDVELSATSRAENPLLLKVKGSVDKGMLKDIEVDGNIDMRPEVQGLDLSVVMTNASIVPFEPFMQGEVTDLSGSVSLRMSLRGTFSEPLFNGEITLKKVAMTIDYFKARYVTSGTFKVNNSEIIFASNTIEDEDGHTGQFSGKITHHNFDKIVLDINLTGLKNFVAMNTTRKDNDYFYGKAIVDGSVKVSGPLDNIYLNVNATAKKGTHIRIPLESENTNTSESYIQFVDLSKTGEADTLIRQKIEGFTMDLLFTITPDSRIDLIFDELTNDMITGRGSGTIRMEINNFGDFYMYGTYVIEEGSYPYNELFVSEEFVFKKGGTITWDGDPYAARINMEATVRKMANPAGLFTDPAQQEYYRPIPVDCQLFLTGQLFSPDIKFGLDFPDITSMGSRPNEFMARMTEIKANEDELNRQFFAVLALGMFVPPSNSDEELRMTGFGSQSFSNSVSGVLNKYMNQMLQDVPGGLEVGVNWSGTTTEQQNQLQVAIRKKFMKDRLEMSGSVDAASANENPWEVKAIYNLDSAGRVKIQAFMKRANDPTSGGFSSSTTQRGVGFYFRRQMDEISFRRKKKNPE